ncbi:E3 ubiquitin ligase family protein [Candidatus Oscillochloris fontis]|uniref:E3 ubiquitin ligase family protein n=1 Tax=Candidatus Oscillochloris fontis TaxID=2496868 RepID=UPI00101DA1F1|nr:E3 ubiquitin ligase family protein [Candidatus Oscillochloris fontis]
MVISGIVLLIVAVICFFVARSKANALHAMNAADTYTAQLLSEVHRKITSTLGGDGWAQPCEIEGVIECDSPLKGPVSGQPCVAYLYTQSREYEERVTETDSEGKRETSVQRRSEQLRSEDRRIKFSIRDETGQTLVLPEGADLDLVETGKRFDQDEKPWTGATRTLGQSHVEQSLAVGTKVYILGCAVDRQGSVAIGKHPRDSKHRFMISRKSEQELASSAAFWSRNLYYAAGGSGVLGVILVIVGMLG